MNTVYSKPLGDVAAETGRILREEAAHLRREREVAALLARGEPRAACCLCGEPLAEGGRARHRDVPYVFCRGCGHLQSERLPSPEHDEALARLNPFHAIYPQADSQAYQSRVDRVYRPKLDWILASGAQAGLSRESLLERRWLELGCGAGYFLKALRDAGCRSFGGVDGDERLAEAANSALGDGCVSRHAGGLAEAVRASGAGAFAAFFVLEHLRDLPDLAAALRAKPAGTVFAFSVPVFGLGAMLESGFDHFFARNLDSGVHVQLFTDRSIARFLADAGYAAVSRWVFGQDASDFIRMLLGRVGGLYPPEILESAGAGLLGLQDELQAVFDRNLLADSRHILAVRS